MSREEAIKLLRKTQLPSVSRHEEMQIVAQVITLLESESEPEPGEFTKDFLLQWLRSDAIPRAIQDGCNRSAEIIDHLSAELKTKDKALREYGSHCRASDRIMCEKDKHSDYPCTCGFEQALKGGEIEILESENDSQTCEAELKTKDAELERLHNALRRIDNWAKAYPIEAFPPPDLKKARAVLKAAGMTLDAISADAMRHVLDGITEIVEQALKGHNEKNNS